MGYGFQWHAVGKRKTSIARVWMRKGSGKIIVNKRTLDDYFGGHDSLKMLLNQPLVLTNNFESFDIHVNVCGGGLAGQAGAIRHGIAKALLTSYLDLGRALKRAGMITRDARVKERKKYGLAAARRRFQFSKR